MNQKSIAIDTYRHRSTTKASISIIYPPTSYWDFPSKHLMYNDQIRNTEIFVKKKKSKFPVVFHMPQQLTCISIMTAGFLLLHTSSFQLTRRVKCCRSGNIAKSFQNLYSASDVVVGKCYKIKNNYQGNGFVEFISTPLILSQL